KRIGIVERTGRGVDIIFEGLLRTGRPAPDYGRSDAGSVAVRLPGGEADLQFVELVVEAQRRAGTVLSVDDLLVLRRLRDTDAVDVVAVASLTQRDERAAGAVLENLVELGLVERRGDNRHAAYRLSASANRLLGRPGASVPQTRADLLRQERMVLEYTSQHGRITRREAAELCRIS